MVQEPVEDRGGDHRIGEHCAPFGNAAVRRNQHGASFVAAADQLEEQMRRVGLQRQVIASPKPTEPEVSEVPIKLAGERPASNRARLTLPPNSKFSNPWVLSRLSREKATRSKRLSSTPSSLKRSVSMVTDELFCGFV